MKKILFLLALIAVAFISLPVAAGASALAFFPIFSKPTMSVDEIEKLTENFSSFNGEDYDQFSSYEGNAMMSIIDTSRVFTLTLSSPGTAYAGGGTMFLLPGASFVKGVAASATNNAGVLLDGAASSTFNKAGSANTNLVVTSNTVTSLAQKGTASKALESLWDYVALNPTLLNMIKFTYNTTSTIPSGNLIYRELSPFGDLNTINIPLAQNQNEFTLNSKYSQINLLQYNIIACGQSQLEYVLPAIGTSESIVIELYFAKTLNSSAQLKQQIAGALNNIPQLSNVSNLPPVKSANVIANTQKRLG